MNLLSDLSLWNLSSVTEDAGNANGIINGRWVVDPNGQLQLAAGATAGDTIVASCTWDLLAPPDSGEVWFIIREGNDTVFSAQLYDTGQMSGSFDIDIVVTEGAQPTIEVCSGTAFPQNQDPPDSYNQLGTFVIVPDVTPPTPTSGVSFNCTCEGADGVQYRTLAELRTEMLIGLGRGNQLASPGPGVAALVDMHLRNAQNLLYNRAQWLICERYYTWPLEEGVVLYGISENVETCSKRLNPNKVTWVGIRRDDIFMSMRQGIYPTLHSYDALRGYPQRFEIRQCIEIWPAPDVTEGYLVIKGNFGLQPFVADADMASIDDYLICQLALGTLKRHFRQPDAADYFQAAEVLLNNLVAGTHTGMARYIPGRSQSGEVIWTEPVADPPFSGGP